MDKKIWIINLVILALLSSILIFIVAKYALTAPQENEATECINIDSIIKSKYISCYDTDTDNILLTIRKLNDLYPMNKIKISFIEYKKQDYIIEDLPDINQTKIYRISSLKKPETLEITFNIEAKNILAICNQTKTITIIDCGKNQSELSGYLEVSQTVSQISNINKTIEVPIFQSDSLPVSLFNQNQIFDLACKSDWKCQEWEMCINGIQKRSCIDKNNCPIPINVPDFTKLCAGQCAEDWECQWSTCSTGFVTPTCRDLSSCGTEYLKPKPIECGPKTNPKCIPEIICDDWTECKMDYNFIGLLTKIQKTNGITSRICRDKNNCIGPAFETKPCSVNVDIYTRWIYVNNERYLEIYNKLSNESIARVLSPENPRTSSLEIQLEK
ncbi:MAG: hypothetical protein Q7S33_04100 [Nanoarchaeota archaeon]|nr:hypothetical protein [Nanoarchaeota archaeon]